MKRLLQLLYRHRAFVVFVLLELVSAVLIFHRDVYKASVSHTVGNIHSLIREVKNYPSLRKENTQLLQENAALREKLLQSRELVEQVPADTVEQYTLIPARVINNSVIGTKNYLTLNQGAKQGIAPGMGVVGTEGIVGKVKAVSDSFATVISLLHTSMQVSAKLEHTGVLGTVHWPGKDHCQAKMLYVPRHIQVEPGDVVVTSGYNATFFEGALIGYVKQVVLRKEAPFYDIELKLSTDFSTLEHVYVVNNALEQERSTLEQRTKKFYE